MNCFPLNANETLFGNQFKILKTIGKGGFSFIYLVEDLNLNKFAIKEFFMSKCFQRDTDNRTVICTSEYNQIRKDTFQQNFLNEAIIMKSFCHPNVITSYGYFEENNTIYNVMPFLKGITLSQYIETNGKLAEDEAITIIRRLSAAIKYVHSKNICHFDITPNNVFLQNENPILIDFGLSHNYNILNPKSSRIRSISPGYAPLELFEKNGVPKFSPATDIFGLGATLFTMLTGTIPPTLKSIWHGGLCLPLKNVSLQTQMVIKTAMQICISRRFSCIEQFLHALPS